MIATKVKWQPKFQPEKVLRKLSQEDKRAMFRIGAYARKVARSSIKRRGKRTRLGASKAGTPPHTKFGALKNAIRFWAEERSVIIGPARSAIGQVGAIHEHGEKAKVKSYNPEQMNLASYPKRPFMKPAMDETLQRLPTFWEKSKRR